MPEVARIQAAARGRRQAPLRIPAPRIDFDVHQRIKDHLDAWGTVRSCTAREEIIRRKVAQCACEGCPGTTAHTRHLADRDVPDHPLLDPGLSSRT